MGCSRWHWRCYVFMWASCELGYPGFWHTSCTGIAGLGRLSASVSCLSPGSALKNTKKLAVRLLPACPMPYVLVYLLLLDTQALALAQNPHPHGDIGCQHRGCGCDLCRLPGVERGDTLQWEIVQQQQPSWGLVCIALHHVCVIQRAFHYSLSLQVIPVCCIRCVP